MKELTLIRILNSDGLNGKSIRNSVIIFNDSYDIDSNSMQSYWDEQCFVQILLG
jgi:hypothetical protein